MMLCMVVSDVQKPTSKQAHDKSLLSALDPKLRHDCELECYYRDFGDYVEDCYRVPPGKLLAVNVVL